MAELKKTLEGYANLSQLLEAKWADPDVNVLLYQRDALADGSAALSAADLAVLAQADAVLASKWQIVADFVPSPSHTDRSHWWWFLHEGPQVRTQAQEQAHA